MSISLISKFSLLMISKRLHFNEEAQRSRKAKVIQTKSLKPFPQCPECNWVDKYRKMKSHLLIKH